MRRLRLDPEYGAGPLWDDDWDGESDIAPTPESLGLSADLCEALNTWQAIHDATLNQEYPPDSAFPSEHERLAWEQSGRDLLRRLQAELGETAVVRLAIRHA